MARKQPKAGDWRVEIRDEGKYVYAGEQRICYPLGDDGNAELIASAPDLLQALVDILDNDYHHINDRRYHAGYEAIKKATVIL